MATEVRRVHGGIPCTEVEAGEVSWIAVGKASFPEAVEASRAATGKASWPVMVKTYWLIGRGELDRCGEGMLVGGGRGEQAWC
jgi:hypothetical protein